MSEVQRSPNSTISLKQNCFKQRELQALVIHQWRLHRCHADKAGGQCGNLDRLIEFPMCFPQKMPLKRCRNPVPMILFGSLPNKFHMPYLKLETQLLGTVKGPGSESGWRCWMSQHFLKVKHRQSWKDAGLKTHQNTEFDHSNWRMITRFRKKTRKYCEILGLLKAANAKQHHGSVTHLFS